MIFKRLRVDCLMPICFLWVNQALGSSLQHHSLPVVSNRIETIDASCDAENFNVTVTLQHPFKGLLFAKDFSQECKTLGSLTNDVKLNLPTDGCGVRLSSEKDKDGFTKMIYSITIVLQQDRHLRQIADREKFVYCEAESSEFSVRSKPMLEVIRNNLLEKSQRKGRMQHYDWSEESDEDEESNLNRRLDETLLSARAWMEILPDVGEDYAQGRLKVGDPAILIVKSTLPIGIGWKIVDCTAHDGLGDSSQKLLDERGCPIDALVLPSPEMGPVKSMTFMRHQEAVARFAAFKFPDRDLLHVSCGLQLCRDACPEIDCDNENSTDSNRLARTLSDGEKGEILDQLEIFNSVEVLAPTIDNYRNSENNAPSEDVSAFLDLPGDRTFCVSPNKMAISFCILGMVFLCAIVIATGALLKARRSGANLPYYSRSLFSSSSGSGFGSKLLMQDSPSMVHSSTKGLQYGRIL